LLIELTPAGRKLVDAALTDHVANENRLLGGLSDMERHQLAALLRKLQIGLPPAEG
jgi:DNA-binding MarR family transcriptional regulator